MQQEPLFYDDVYDALRRSIAASGKPLKEIAQSIYPGRKPETAQGLLSRALTPENTDVHLSIEAILTILKETRSEDLIFFLCDEFGLERPARKTHDSFEKEIKGDLRTAMDLIKSLTRKVDTMEKSKHAQ